MEFSELFKQSKNLCKFSPNGKYLGCIIQYRLVIRNAHDLEIVNLFNFTDNLQAICWSRDSTLIACASFNLGSIQIWNLVDPNWSCRIDEGLGGLTKILFSPDSRHLLTFSDFQLRITVWNLINKSVRYMQYPKFDNKGFCFRKDGKYFSLVERKECKDFISVFDCEDWEMVKHFQTDTFDLEDIAWSPDGRFIAAWESSLDYKVLLYFPDGRLVSTFSREITGLGIKSVKWSPSAQFLAVGGYDKKKIYQEVNYETKLNSFDTSDKIFENLYNKTRKGYELVDVEKFPFKIPILKLIPEKPNPKMGVGLLEFNCDGRYLVSRNGNSLEEN
ncbi:WD repeat-containing protein wrap73 [Clydaea vesicula]|uniref:WD repeat-containing protein wrap73 n=1 Tax=Clydaea vesicula TaxID=447962 RepID=A0AAD5U1H7_9FUNG|nr:WD repeat-containing protein wrap73 [Clydaea vesicula]